MKEKLKKIFQFLKKPNTVFSCLCYGIFFAFTALAFVLLFCEVNPTLVYIAYSGMGITFFYCCYLFIMYDFKKIKLCLKNLKLKIASKNKFLNKLFYDIYYRTLLFTCFSLFLGICFVAYNAFAGLYYHSIWNGSISVYYALLVIIRIAFLLCENKILRNKNISEEEREFKRAKIFKTEGILLICVNIALIAPITLLATTQKNVNLPMWVAIADACFTFYKMTVCIYSFVKTRKNNNLAIKGIKNLNLISACVSLLSLENTMIITFSTEIESGMKILMILSSFLVVVVNMWISISTIITGNKKLKATQSLSQSKLEYTNSEEQNTSKII